MRQVTRFGSFRRFNCWLIFRSFSHHHIMDFLKAIQSGKPAEVIMNAPKRPAVDESKRLHGDSQSKLDECVKRSLSCAKFLLYTTLFPEHRVATELTEDRVELLRAFTKHFDLQIASQNLHECLAQLEYRIVAAVLKIDRDVESKEKVSAHYIFDKMEYYSSAEIAVFHHVRYGKMIGITVRLPNDGFLYGENDNFALKRPTTIDHTAHQWFQLAHTETHHFQESKSFATRMGELVRCCVAAAIPATGSPPAAIKVFGQFLYTAQGQCMDLKYKCSLVTGEDLQLIVSVQYEPGAPVTYFDEDRWDEL